MGRPMFRVKAIKKWDAIIYRREIKESQKYVNACETEILKQAELAMVNQIVYGEGITHGPTA